MPATRIALLAIVVMMIAAGYALHRAGELEALRLERAALKTREGPMVRDARNGEETSTGSEGAESRPTPLPTPTERESAESSGSGSATTSRASTRSMFDEGSAGTERSTDSNDSVDGPEYWTVPRPCPPRVLGWVAGRGRSEVLLRFGRDVDVWLSEGESFRGRTLLHIGADHLILAEEERPWSLALPIASRTRAASRGVGGSR
ncbi:MAG: hypothetical protein KDC38_13655 [Planctomycetes bacterium]|nr:hypothetical protein [Planctomycetota bacterium]